MAKFDKFRGRDALAKAVAKSGGGGAFTPTIQWDKDGPGAKKYVQFLAELDDLLTVPMHSFMRTGKRDDGKWIYNDFIVVPDDDGSSPYDPIADRFGEPPKEKGIMVGVEMEPIIERVDGKKKIVGFNVKEREWKDKDGETHTTACVGLIVQSPFNFWKQLATVEQDAGPIEESVFVVTRSGESKDTDYTFLPVGDALTEEELDISADEMVKLDEWLEERADEDRMHRLIDDLPDDWAITQYPSKKKDKGEEKSSKPKSKSSSTRSRRSAPAVEVEEEEAEEPTPPKRKSRFASLKQEVEAG